MLLWLTDEAVPQGTETKRKHISATGYILGDRDIEYIYIYSLLSFFLHLLMVSP